MTEETKKPLHCIECGQLCATKEVWRLIAEHYPTGIIKTPSECSYEYTCQKCGHKTLFTSSFSFGCYTKEEEKRFSLERSILGNLMLQCVEFDNVICSLEFKHWKHKKIFAAMLALNKEKFPIDLITVSNFLREKNELEEIGGTDYIVEILNKTTSDIKECIEKINN